MGGAGGRSRGSLAICASRYVDRVVELHVVAVDQAVRVEVQLDVGIDAVAFDNPIAALRVPAAEFRLRDHATVAQRLVAADADPAAPGARADDRAELELLETEGEGLAIAAALAVDQCREVTAEGVRRGRVHVAVAGAADGQDLPVQVRQDHRRDESAMIPAIVDDERRACAIATGNRARTDAGREPIHVVQVNVADVPLLFLSTYSRVSRIQSA